MHYDFTVSLQLSGQHIPDMQIVGDGETTILQGMDVIIAVEQAAHLLHSDFTTVYDHLLNGESFGVNNMRY
jgi:hypothetical protein